MLSVPVDGMLENCRLSWASTLVDNSTDGFILEEDCSGVIFLDSRVGLEVMIHICRRRFSSTERFCRCVQGGDRSIIEKSPHEINISTG